MILASINHKGGTGKTIVAQNLAVCYANQGKKTCIVDSDPSQNSVQWFASRPEDQTRIPVFPNQDWKTLRKTVTDLYTNEDYDVIIIDSPPTLERIASEIIQLAHMVLIPISPTGGNDIWSTEQIADSIDHLSQQKGSPIPSYFIINRIQPGFNVHEMFVQALEAHSKTYKIGILDSRLHLRTAFGAANMYGLGVGEYTDPKAKKEVAALAEEVLNIFDKL